MLHLQEPLSASPNPLKTARIRENKLQVSCGQLKVVFGLRLFLDE